MNSFDSSFPPSQLLCPMIRLWSHQFKEKKYGDIDYYIIANSCYLSDATEEDKNNSNSHQLNLLFWCNNKQDQKNDFECWACCEDTIGTTYYYCNGCSKGYHKECVDSPSVFISPYHSKYSFQLVKFYNNYSYKELLCHSCGTPPKHLAYYSSVCDITLDLICARKIKTPSLYNKKRHEHTLYYFTRIASLICNVCGTDDNRYCFYICLQCNFVVHITCIDLPRVIQTSRHIHRLFYTSSFSSGIVLACGVCRQAIDGSYGEYSCSKGCTYAVHIKCAMLPEVCDGKELEDEPEKQYHGFKTYERIDDGIIQHFSHPDHTMKYDQDINKSHYEKKQCEACLLSLYCDSSVYKCTQCDFVLHEACAHLPSIKQSMVHAHLLILKSGNIKDYFLCRLCDRESFGFKYECCEGCNISLDVRCASLSEPVNHPSHQHPLFLLDNKTDAHRCSICGRCNTLCIRCVTCDFALCFTCATLPYKIKHEDDEYWITLSYENNESYPYWCQIFEEQMDPHKGYYTCNEYGTTFHVYCILGEDPYMKPGTTKNKVDIISNDHFIRPICNGCKRRCPYKIAFKTQEKIFCSLYENLSFLYDIYKESLTISPHIISHVRI